MPAEWRAFVVVVAAYLVYLPFSGYDTFPFDAQRYWNLANSFGTGGHLDLFGFTDPLRGYSFPLALHELRWFTSSTGFSPVAAVRVCNAVLVALLGAVLFPRLISRMFSGAVITLPRILAFNVLIFIYWRDHLNSPLTDFPLSRFGALRCCSCSEAPTTGLPRPD